jgi:P4 family phage/plasmid primase-like protien
MLYNWIHPNYEKLNSTDLNVFRISYEQMAESYNELLQSARVDGGEYTHVSMIRPLGKYGVFREHIEEFWRVYHASHMGDVVMGLGEKPQEYVPVLVDVDIRIRCDDIDVCPDVSGVMAPLYTRAMVMQTIAIYRDILTEVIDAGSNNVETTAEDRIMTCVLLEKPPYVTKAGTVECYKSGFHLHFPYVFVSRIDMKMQINPRAKQRVATEQVFDAIRVCDRSSIIDDAVCSVPWLLYNSRKAVDAKPYRVSEIFDGHDRSLTVSEAFTGYSLYDVDGAPISVDATNAETILPRILSIIPAGRRIYDLRRELVSPLRTVIRNKHRARDDTNVPPVAGDIAERIAEATVLINMMDVDRAERYDDWIKIGWALYSISGGHVDALDVWNTFSNRSSKYNESHNLCLWDKMSVRNLGMGTLYYYAKEDNAAAVAAYRIECRSDLIVGALDGTHWSAALVLHSMFGDRIKCSSIQNNTWYHFNGQIWATMDDGYVLSRYISTDLAKKFATKMAEISLKIASTTDEPMIAMYSAQAKAALKAHTCCKSTPWKRCVMRECREIFYDQTFRLKLDRDKYKFAFKNGVYDLRTHKLRDGQPDDFISVHSPIDYSTFQYTDELVLQCEELLCKLFPDEHVRQYFTSISADKFVGGNTHKTFDLWTGSGDNGKSIIQTLFELIFGKMAVKLNTQYFTGKKPPTGSANPELIRTAPPVRHVTMEEPDGDEQLNTGELKKLSGQDSFLARDLFQKGADMVEVVPFFTLTLICNKLPAVRHGDDATYRRFRVIPFESQFVDDCPESFEDQLRTKRFPKDREFSSKLPGLAPAMAWYLLKYREINGNTIIIPDKIMAATNSYRQQNDIYIQFIADHIREDPNKRITINELYGVFKDWHREGFPQRPVPSKNDTKSYFVKEWGNPRGITWRGYYYIADGDDIDMS